jgi:LysM repeat protein
VLLSRFRAPIGQAFAASACVVAAVLGASACGGDTLGVATTVVAVTPTNFATIPPVASTAPGTTTTLPANAVGTEQDYTVVAGDSPLAVASKFNIALTTLLAYNGWVSPAQFPYPGTIIKIPANAVVAPSVTSAPGAADPAAPAAPAGPASAGCGTRPAGTYEIQKGDSFYGIYKKFCVSPTALLAANNWADNSVVLLVGKVINIPAAGS